MMDEQYTRMDTDPNWQHWLIGALGGMAYLILIAILGG